MEQVIPNFAPLFEKLVANAFDRGALSPFNRLFFVSRELHLVPCCTLPVFALMA